MTDALKVLGQVKPDAQTLTDAYTVPALKSATISSLTVCNQGSSADKFRLAVAVAGAADDPKQYLYWDFEVPANDSFSATLGITLAAADVLRVYANSAYLSFNCFGVEVS